MLPLITLATHITISACLADAGPARTSPVALSPDERTVFAVDEDAGTVRIWTWAEFDNVKVTRLVPATRASSTLAAMPADPPATALSPATAPGAGPARLPAEAAPPAAPATARPEAPPAVRVPALVPAPPAALPSARALARDIPCRAEFLEVEGRPAFVFLPEAPAPRPAPWVWYAPTLDGHPDPSHGWMFRRFLERGIAIAGIDVGESFGSPRGRATYAAFSRFVEERLGLAGKAILLPQSRGGLMLYSWAVEEPRRVAGIAGIYTVCDLRSYPGLDKACGAYGMAEVALAAGLSEHNPIDRLKPLADAKVPILHTHGDSDSVVPLEKNAGELIRRYRELGGPGQLIVVPGKGHEVVPEFFQSQAFVDFILRVAGGPIAHWPLDEAGDRALDASGNGHDGTLVGGPRRVPGVFGSAIELDGIRQSISIPHADSLKPQGSISFSAWVSPATLAGVRHIYRKDDGGDRHLFAFQEDGSVLALGLGFGGAYRELDAPIRPQDFTPGTWHHVAATFDGKTARVFVDGREIASMPASGPIGAAGTAGTGGTAPAFIGADKGTESFFAGKIDDLRIHARALPAGEIRALYEEAPEAIRRAAEEARAASEARR
jgi:hypothetical protein